MEINYFPFAFFTKWAVVNNQIKEFPKKVILFCEIPPPEGGETPFVPSFRVAERMMEEFPEEVKEMEEKGLKYSFTAPSNNDTSSMRGRGWEDAFGTSDPKEAEKRYFVSLQTHTYNISTSLKHACYIVWIYMTMFSN